MIIRPATIDDADEVLALRNSQESVFWSGKPPIAEIEHQQWFPRHMHTILVLADSSGVWGYARVADDGQVSFAVDASVSGHGYGRQLLKALEGMYSGLQLSARVHPSNIASMRAFMHAGYMLDKSDGIFQVVAKWL